MIKKIQKNTITLLIPLLFLTLSLITTINAEEITTTMYIEPQMQNIEPKQTFIINISCNPTQEIEGFEFDIIFDATYLKINSINEGNIFQGYSTWFNPGTIDNTKGYINNIYSLITEEGNTSQAGILASISCTAFSKNGTTTIHFNDTGISNDFGYIPIQIQNGTINIGNISTPPIDQPEPTNFPPNLPEKPTGEQIGIMNIMYTYSTKTFDIDHDQIYYTFNWGDGSINTNIGPYLSNQTCNASHTWTQPGVYNITVLAEDYYGNQSNWSPHLTVIIQNQTINNSNDDPNPTIPIASFTYTPNNPKINTNIQFTDTSLDSTGLINKWRWDFGDDTYSDKQHPIHLYDEKKTYKIELTVWDDTGLYDTYTQQINIESIEESKNEEQTSFSFLMIIGIIFIITVIIIYVIIKKL